MHALALVPTPATMTATTKTATKLAPRRDPAARDAIVTGNMGLVRMLANHLHWHVADFMPADDLVGYGSIGLIEAAERFDESWPLPFNLFARYRIRGAMFDAIRREGTSQNGLSRHAYKELAAEERVNRLLQQEALTRYGEDSSPGEALEYVGDVLTMIARVHSLSSVHSEDVEPEADSEESQSYGNRWNGEPLVAPTEPLFEGNRVREALAVLTPKQRKLIELVYWQGMELFEAARELGIRSGTVCKLHARALAALRAVVAPETGL